MKNKKAASGWRHELDKDPKLIELNRRLVAKKRALEKDKEFVIETEKLRTRLERALAKHPKYIRRFLHYFSYPVGTRLPELNDFVNSIGNAQLRKLLEDYVKYVARFGVVLRLRKGNMSIVVEYLVPWGRTFHVRLVNGHFEPGDGYTDGDTPYEYFFESDRVMTQMPPYLRKRLQLRNTKFFKIEDPSWSSVLIKMEYFAYDPECLTFVLHNAEQPYLLCLIGEKVTNKLWGRASAVVSAFLRVNFNRGKAGRPRDVRRFQRMLKLRKGPGLIKEKLAVKGEDEGNFLSEQAYSARVGKLVRVPD